MQHSPFVPGAPRSMLAEVEARWASLCRGNPAYFDGRICHVLGAHRNGHGGATIHAADCAYRFWAVQAPGFDLGVRPLGVKGITMQGSRVLVGQRSNRVAGYPGLWEFAPGGVVEPGEDAAPPRPEAVIRRELEEETGLRTSAEPVALAVLFDDALGTWEIVYRMDVAPSADPPRAAEAEYERLEWRRRDDLPEAMSPIALRIARSFQ
jgi:8-oxo-dGTP pyrophosphatase MutT (NUDIX family)